MLKRLPATWILFLAFAFNGALDAAGEKLEAQDHRQEHEKSGSGALVHDADCTPEMRLG